jgi:hypothetical protein
MLELSQLHTDDILDEEQAQAARKEDVLDVLSQIAKKLRTRVFRRVIELRPEYQPYRVTDSHHAPDPRSGAGG